MDNHIHRDLSKNIVNYDRDPLLFFPYISLPSILLGDGQTARTAIDDIYATMQKVRLYDTNSSKWNIKEPSRAQPVEQIIPDFFNRVLSAAYTRTKGCGRQTAWRQHSATLIEGIRKPDVILVPAMVPERVTFQDIYSYCELKYAFKKDLNSQSLFQLTEIAGFIIAAQVNRRFFVASSLCGRTLTLAFFARGCIVFSKALNIDQHPREFLIILIGISSADCTWNGFDDHLRVGAKPHTYILHELGDFFDVEVQDLLLFAANAMHGRGTKVPLCKARLGSYSGEELWCILKLSWLPVRRTTDIEISQLMKTREPNDLSEEEEKLFGETDKYSVFRDSIKPSIQVQDEGATNWDYQRHLPGIPIILDVLRPLADNPKPNYLLREEGYYGPVHEPNMRFDTTTNILERFDVPVRDDDNQVLQVLVQKKEGKMWAPMPLYQEPREYIMVLSRTCGTSLVWFSCRREFVNGMMGALVGHFNGLRKDILHCDVSDGNVLYEVEGAAPEHVVPDWPKDDGQYPKRAGMLGDWGYAEDLHAAPAERVGRLTGTFPFMASDLLSVSGTQGKTCHQVRHDLESLFWVIWITCVNMDGPFYKRRIWRDEVENITKEALPNPRESGAAARRSASRPATTPTTPTVANSAGSFASGLELSEPWNGTTIVPVLQQDTRQMADTATRTPYDRGHHPPVWATPGVHQCGSHDVYEWKCNIPTPWFYNAISPYFRASGEGFRQGLEKLRDYFAADKKETSGEITHEIFFKILKDMRDSIPAAQDRTPDEEIKEGRARYKRLLAQGGSQGIAISVLDGPKIRGPAAGSASAKRQATTGLDAGAPCKRVRSSASNGIAGNSLVPHTSSVSSSSFPC